MGLTAKRKAFITAYMVSKNATRAAIEAGYSEDTAYSIGYELLRIPEVNEEIQRRLSENAMSAEEVLSLIADIARADMGDFVTFRDGVNMPYLDLKKAHDSGKMKLIKKVRYNEQGQLEFELHDSLAALNTLAKFHKLLTDRQEVTGKDGESLVVAVVKMAVDDL